MVEQLLTTLDILNAKILNTIGLLLNIIGGVLVFFFGFSQPSFEEGISLGLELNNLVEDGRTREQHDRDIRDK